MEEDFSPKQVAEALRVSESSIKRWCDQGAIGLTKTQGGHRRISLAGLMSFLESSNRQIVDPSSLGMGGLIACNKVPGNNGQIAQSDDLPSIRASFEAALIRGDEKESRGILAKWYSECQSLAKVSDDLIAPTFHRLGELWHDSAIEIFQERRACEICTRLIHEFRRLMIEPLPSAPLALGCTSSGDHYSIPGQLIELVLRETGWRATNIGSNLPLKSLEEAVRREQPKLVWLSVSYLSNPTQFIQELQQFWDAIPRNVSLIVGGRALTDELRPHLRYTAHCDTMQQLSTLAWTLRNRSSDSRI